MKYREHRQEIVETVDKLITLIRSIPENKKIPGHEYIEKYSRGRDLRGHWASYAEDIISECVTHAFWPRKEGDIMKYKRVEQLKGVRWGTSHFVNMGSAVRYYAQTGETQSLADKIKNGEITIGPPKGKENDTLAVDGDGRFWLVEGVLT